MKKLYVLLALGIATMLTFTGCGDDTKDDTNDSGVVGEAIPEDEDVTVDDYTDSELPPEEGMVRSYITNEWVDEEVANTRPIAVMMPTDKIAQPQYGISQASVLYECMEEGGISRQMAIIEDWEGLEKIGNIRSCRLYYACWSTEWDSILVHAGGIFTMDAIMADPIMTNISLAGESGVGSPAPGSDYFFRSSDKSAPHNAYISSEGIDDAIVSLGYEKEHRSEYYDPDHFTFAPFSAPTTLEDGETANKIDLANAYPYTKSYLEYNEEDGLYYKFLHNEAQVDAMNDMQLTFKNVIVQITYSETLIGKPGDADYQTFQVNDTTRGGYYFTNGKCIPITWKKTSDFGATKYYDLSGNEIELNTGKTYIAVVQEGKSVSWE